MRPYFSNITLGILAVILAAGILLISIACLMHGIATGLGTVFVAQPWLGWILTGGFFLIWPLLFLARHFSKKAGVPSELAKLSETLLQKIIASAEGLDLREWTRQHPYQATGTAAAVGFITAGKASADITDLLRATLLQVLAEQLQARPN